ncbi:MAG: AraC family transcriptional regulator [Chloroflexota bacterium]
MELRASSIIDSDLEGHYAFFPFVEGISTQLHHHDFYELFLIAKGSINHHINGEMHCLKDGTLVFIRPDDAHFFSRHGDANCELLNLAFLQHTFEHLSDYLGKTLTQTALLERRLPPYVMLTMSDSKRIMTQLRDWGRFAYRDKAQSRFALRGILAYLISDYFVNAGHNQQTDLPDWLADVCETMQQPEHIIEGRKALMQLANRSPEYVGRMFKHYLNTTPSQYINDLRLDYASDLLRHSDASPTEIAFEVGFGNVSHFYHLFKARWQCSPNEFRKQSHRILNP